MRKLEVKETDHILFSGVCASLSNFLNIDVSLLRLVFIVSGFISYYTLIFYIVASIVIPSTTHNNDEAKASTNPKNPFYIIVACILLLLISLLYYFNIPIFTFSIKLPFTLSIILQILFVLTAAGFYFFKTNQTPKKKIEGKIISGIFGGIGKSVKVDPTILRLIYILILTFFNKYSIILILMYFFLAVVLPYNVDQETNDRSI